MESAPLEDPPPWDCDYVFRQPSDLRTSVYEESRTGVIFVFIQKCMQTGRISYSRLRCQPHFNRNKTGRCFKHEIHFDAVRRTPVIDLAARWDLNPAKPRGRRESDSRSAHLAVQNLIYATLIQDRTSRISTLDESLHSVFRISRDSDQLVGGFKKIQITVDRRLRYGCSSS